MRRQGQRVSVRELARACGVSTATVSRAFAEPHLVAPETRGKVREVAARLGYRPAPAPGPSPSRASRICVVFQHIESDDPHRSAFVGRMVAAAEQACQTLSAQLSTVIIRDPDSGFDELLELCRPADGLLAVSCTASRSVVLRLQRHRPLVIVNDLAAAAAGVASFVPDDFATIECLLRHLHALGHRRVIYFHINDANPPNPHLMLRHGAFEALIRHPELTMPQARAVVPTSRAESLVDTARTFLAEWLAGPEPPTAILCGNDYYALAFLQAAQAMGLRVPNELSITGIDDQDFAAHLQPPLTTVRQPLETIAADAVHYLVRRLAGEPLPVAQHAYPVTLIERQSTAPVTLAATARP